VPVSVLTTKEAVLTRLAGTTLAAIDGTGSYTHNVAVIDRQRADWGELNQDSGTEGQYKFPFVFVIDYEDVSEHLLADLVRKTSKIRIIGGIEQTGWKGTGIATTLSTLLNQLFDDIALAIAADATLNGLVRAITHVSSSTDEGRSAPQALGSMDWEVEYFAAK